MQTCNRETQVALKVKVTIPRRELVAAVNSVRLAKKVKESLRISLTGLRYFTGPSAVLGMLKMIWEIQRVCGGPSQRSQGQQ
jgi:hypothetical protein